MMMTPDEAVRLAVQKFHAGQQAEAQAILLKVIAADPNNYNAHFCLGEAAEHQGRLDEAVERFALCMNLRPGMAQGWSRHHLIRLRRHIGSEGSPQALSAAAGKRHIVQMSSLGSNGRFGNQILQYAFLRSYAERYDLAFGTPDWIGRALYGLNDPLIDRQLPELRETDTDLVGMLRGTVPTARANVDLWGYFVDDMQVLEPYRERIRTWFKPARSIADPIAGALDRLRSGRKNLVAVHFRRGDFGYGRFWIAPPDWYVRWLESLWSSLDNPVLYLATDDPATRTDLARFAPMTAADLGVSIPGAEFMLDHLVLANADYLAISNSTFSFTASMLADRRQVQLRPSREAGGLIPFDPWRESALLP